ncbi:MAG: lysozyme inhibitor LprI family protein, partial [Gemmatimonadaceae bacterium]
VTAAPDSPAATAPEPVSRPRQGRARSRARRADGAPQPLRVFARTHDDSLRLCASPASRDQRACLMAAIAENDYGLNNVYNTLIKEMRKQAGTAVGGPDPASVARLRAEQRAWLVERDEACERRLSGRSGSFWAVPRARCLGQLSSRRASVLADRLTRLRAP